MPSPVSGSKSSRMFRSVTFAMFRPGVPPNIGQKVRFRSGGAGADGIAPTGTRKSKTTIGARCRRNMRGLRREMCVPSGRRKSPDSIAIWQPPPYNHRYRKDGTMPENDPRVFFAAERTLLAWIRTGLGLVAMGFVVAKFGLFFRILHPESPHTDHSWAGPIGIALAIMGALASASATWQHRRFCQTLTINDLPRQYLLQPGLLLGFGVAVAGLVLAMVLVV
ncbi:MAG: hypothetical protein C0467_22610 [Planctomycetaceae bacterium]|nr:hypothetical protein [Planctomycetaceae bacterium]